jgi:hypothetical protein
MFFGYPCFIIQVLYQVAQCASCNVVELRSGDVAIFSGHPDVGLAHGVLDTLVDTAPEGLPAWAAGSRVSLQYRLLRPPAAAAGSGVGGGSKRKHANVIDLTDD